MSTKRQKTLALAAIFQAAALVDQIAYQGTCTDDALEFSLESLLTNNLSAFIKAIEDSPSHLNVGFHALEFVLGQSKLGPAKFRLHEVMRYGLSLIHIQQEIQKNPLLLDTFNKRLNTSQRQRDFFSSITDPGLLRNFAGIYVDTAGTLKFRLQIKGDKKQLETYGNPEKIRAILLTGLYAAQYWRELGGRRWHLLFIRRSTLKELYQISHELRKSI
jgi:high frequency lysogenization protein